MPQEALASTTKVPCFPRTRPSSSIFVWERTVLTPEKLYDVALNTELLGLIVAEPATSGVSYEKATATSPVPSSFAPHSLLTYGRRESYPSVAGLLGEDGVQVDLEGYLGEDVKVYGGTLVAPHLEHLAVGVVRHAERVDGTRV